VTDTAWIDAALTSARPQAVGALLRYFRNLDTAEEAFQNACLRALKSWPQNGPPRDPAAWLIMVGRNVAIDDIRRNRKQEPLPRGRGDLRSRRRRGSAGRTARRLALPRRHSAAAVHLLPSDLPATQQIALALRIVSGLDGETDRPRVSRHRGGDGGSASPAPRRASPTPTCRSRPRAPWSAPSGSRAVAAMDLSDFQRGAYSASRDTRRDPQHLCEEAIRWRGYCFGCSRATEIMGLTAC